MPRRRSGFSRKGIAGLSANKPVVYYLLTDSGNANYVGRAKRGRVRARLGEHLPGGPDPIPARTVRIRQFPSTKLASAAERRAIKVNQPKYNKLHK